MEQLHGTIFLSHAAQDKDFVGEVANRLDPSVTFYDIKTIAPGQSTIEAMKKGVGSASVFVLFHSEEHKSAWVDFEKSLAEVQSITKKGFKLLVCPINGSTYKTLPQWMKSYMTTSEDFNVNDIIRTIKYLYRLCICEVQIEQSNSHPGREALKREITLAVMRSSAALGSPLSALVLSGIQGMGRGSLAAELIRDAYRGMRPAGPIFEIPEAGDAIDWHLALIRDIRGKLTREETAAQIDAFSNLTPQQKATTILASLSHWGKLNQVITIRHRWGLRGRGNSLKPWLLELINILASDNSIRLILISERQLPHVQVASLGNVVQFHLEELDTDTIQYILTERIPARYLDTQRLPLLAERINGHPATANYVSMLVQSGRSMDSLVISPAPIAAFQDAILIALYESQILTDVQKSVLKLLSWLPRISASIISELFPEVDKDLLTESIWELVEFSLLTQADFDKYSCPAVVASTYRRRGEGGYDDLLTRVSEILKDQFENDSLDYALIDSLLVAIISSGMEISPSLKRLLTPARLLPAIENQYYDALSSFGQEQKVHFERCKTLAELAMTMNSLDEDLENILFYGGDSTVRLGQYPKTMIDVMRRKGMLTADYIEGSYLYHQKRDFKQAAIVLENSLSSNRFRVRNVRLLARIYIRDSKFPQALTALSKLQDARLMRDSGLVIMKIRALRGTRNWLEAKKLGASLQGRSDDFGDIALYRAGVCLREGEISNALSYIQTAKRAPKANQAVCAILQCACEIENGDISNLANTCSIARSLGRDPDAFQLQARAALKAGDWKSALEYISQIKRRDWFDLNVELRATQAKIDSSEVKGDPVLASEAAKAKDEILKQIADAVEGNNLAYH